MPSDSLTTPATAPEGGLLSRIKAASAAMGAMFGFRAKPAAGPASSPPSKASFLSSIRIAAARIAGRDAAHSDDPRDATIAALKEKSLLLEQQLADINAQIDDMPRRRAEAAAAQAESLEWFDDICHGRKDAVTHPPQNAFEQELFDRLQGGIAEKARAVGIPTSMLTGTVS